MIKKFYLPMLVALMMATVGCNSKMGGMSADYFTTTPSPLEMIAGEVPVTITGKFPEKYFNKKAVVTVTPYLVYEGGETAGTPYKFQGEKVQGNDQAISYKMGGNMTMKTTFKYIDAMRKSELFLAFSVSVKGKVYELPRVKIADGVVSTAGIANAADATAAIAADKFQRIIKENYEASILFLIQQANLRDSELRGKSVKDLQEELKAATAAPNREITNITISSYASPDGALDLNTKLAENREANTKAYLEKQLKKDKVLAAAIEGQFTAEDWAGFQELVSKSNIQDKELIIRVLSMYNDPEQREAEIKKLSSTFKVLADEILPQLRRSRLIASIDLIGKSDEEIANLAKTDAKALSVDELLYAATLAKSNKEKADIYTKASQIYPNDFRGYNNLGMVYFSEGKVNDAKSWFEKAVKVAPNAPEVQMNLALIELDNNNVAKAEQSLGKASGVNELGEALGLLYIQKGEYSKAVTAFGSTKSNNAALAQILTGDFNKAKNTLSAIATPNATTYYLMAVIGARTNNEQMVTSNLKEVAKLDPAMAKKAATDLEFAKYKVASL